jgi:hypothetical protein
MYRIEDQQSHDEHAFTDANILALGTTLGHAEDAISLSNSKWVPKLVIRMMIKYSYIIRTTIMTYS